MEVPKKFTAVIEYMGENRFLGYIPSIPEIPATLGVGIITTIRRLDYQLKMHNKANFSEQPMHSLDIVLLFPRKGFDSNADCPKPNET